MRLSRQIAIGLIKEDISIHEGWVDWVLNNPTDSIIEHTGDVVHHNQWIERLSLVLDELESQE